MNSSVWLTIASVGATLVGGALGYFLKYFLDKKQEIGSKNADHKRSAYLEVISLMLTVLSQTKLGTLSDKELVKQLNNSYEQCILYASPKVINTFGDLMQYLFTVGDAQSANETLLKMTRVFKAMREDIGLSNEGLGIDAERLMRVRLNDYATAIEGANK